MLFAPVAAPAPLALRGPFAALTIDAQRRRIFAAGARSVAVIDANSGKLLATVRIGGARSLALEPLGGHVFVGSADGRISEIDPDRKAVVRSLDAGAPVDALLYDAVSGRLYAGFPDQASLSEFDTRTFARAAALPLPGVPAQFVPDPITRELYVAFAGRAVIAVVDPQSGAVRTSFPTPGPLGSRIVRFDDVLGQIVVLGRDGLLDVYDRAGTRLARIAVPPGISDCDLDTENHVLACMDPAGLTFVQLARGGAPEVIGTNATAQPALVGLDSKTNDAVVVYSNPDGSAAALEYWSASPPAPESSPPTR